MLRIISGRFGGRKLAVPPGLATRPLPDRIKQSLFDWLGQDLSGQRIADVCSGSGSFALEAVSRGAAEVHAIEAGSHAKSALSANAKVLGQPPELHLHFRQFQLVLPQLKGLDLIFADPPFPWYSAEPTILSGLLCLGRDSLRPQGRLLIRGEQGVDLPLLPSGLREDDRRTYGRSWIASLVRVQGLPIA